MEPFTKKKVALWGILTLSLILAFFIGFFVPTINTQFKYILGFVVIPLLIILNYFSLRILNKDRVKLLLKENISIWVMLILNLLFAFVIGITIPLMESESKYNFALVMIPLLIILNYIIIDRVHYYIRHTKCEKESSSDD
ncbi:MAG: archaeosortase H N-terminal-like domain-containing protein [Promethearchaeota archaeon]